MKRIHVRVPATTSNLGPGFDCLGCALSLYADFTCELTDEGVEITGCDPCYQNEDNLFVVAYRRMEDRLGIPHSGLKLHID
ncbi:MAG: homoserine kinase, partial [Clostridia bacterium]|nr:homoserine kinase [Clostridia bacterium]